MIWTIIRSFAIGTAVLLGGGAAVAQGMTGYVRPQTVIVPRVAVPLVRVPLVRTPPTVIVPRVALIVPQ